MFNIAVVPTVFQYALKIRDMYTRHKAEVIFFFFNWCNMYLENINNKHVCQGYQFTICALYIQANVTDKW